MEDPAADALWVMEKSYKRWARIQYGTHTELQGGFDIPSWKYAQMQNEA